MAFENERLLALRLALIYVILLAVSVVIVRAGIDYSLNCHYSPL